MTDAAALVAELERMASTEERVKYTRYFPPDPDAPFLGVRMGAVFDLAKSALDLPAAELESLLDQPAHEVRALACSIMGKSAAHRRTLPGRSSVRITSPAQVWTANSTACASSRTLPGHGYCSNARKASSVNRAGRRPWE